MSSISYINDFLEEHKVRKLFRNNPLKLCSVLRLKLVQLLPKLFVIWIYFHVLIIDDYGIYGDISII